MRAWPQCEPIAKWTKQVQQVAGNTLRQPFQAAVAGMLSGLGRRFRVRPIRYWIGWKIELPEVVLVARLTAANE